MTKPTNYTAASEEIERALESATVMEDFLPTPSELVRKTEKVKITLAVDKQSLDLYRKYAKKHDAKYQTMINGVLTSYADKFLSRK
jgi:uncharacterized protein (DUF4415 family)